MGETAISVVMPTFNRAAYICEALDSLMLQACPPAEVLVVDDGSTDDTKARVYGHPFASRIRYHLQPERKGASAARNVGVELARSDLVVFLDSDDILETNHHLHVVRVFEALPHVGLFCCDSRMIGPTGESLEERTWTTIQCDLEGWRIQTGERSLVDIFLFSTPFPGLAVRRSTYAAVGGLSQSLFPLDDFDFQMRVAAAGFGVYYEHCALARYRIHSDNESGRARAVQVTQQKLRCIEQALEQHPSLRALGRRGRRRRGEVRRQLAIALVQQNRVAESVPVLLLSLLEDPAGLLRLLRLGIRRLRRTRIPEARQELPR